MNPSVEERAEALLRQKRRIRAPDLVKLIHEINPTGLQLAPAIETRRYVLKSALQSLLIREFADGIVALPVSGNERVVTLRYRPLDRDACHAVIAELDDDARSFVQFQLDAEGEDESRSLPAPDPEGRARSARSPRTAAPPEEPRQLLLLGAQALQAYDFEQARAHLERALSLSGGGEAEALALLELLVDHLAAYSEALEQESRLSPVALRSPGVRGLLALAAAHGGSTTDSLRLLKGADGGHAASAWAVLASAALSQGQLVEAGSYLAQASAAEPALIELVSLDAELARHRADARRPAEAALERVVAAGDDAAAADEAQALLRRWPESALARRVLRDIEARRRAAEAEALRCEGELAHSSEEFERAAAAWRKAAVLGATGLEARIVDATAREEARLRGERTSGAAAALVSSISTESLSRYLGLAPPERQEVRDRTGLVELDWLEHLRRGGPDRERELDVAAVRALSQAAGLGAQGPADSILALLGPHEARLRRIEAACELLEAARRSRDAAALRRAEQFTQEAQEALGTGRFDEAVRLVKEGGALARAELQDEATRILAEARAQLESRQKRRRYEELMEGGRLLEALDLLREPRAGVAEEREFWKRCEVEVSQRLRGSLVLETAECPAGAGAPEYLSTHASREEISYGLDADGDSLYWAIAWGRHLFIRKTSARDPRVRELVSLRLPEPIDFARVHLVGPSLWVSGDPGAALELSTATWDVLRWYSAAGLTSADEVVEQVFAVPDTRALWLSVRHRSSGSETIRVHNLGQGRVQRELKVGLSLDLVAGPAGLGVFAPGLAGDGRILSPQGALEVQVPVAVRALAPLPEGGYLAIRADADEEGLELVRLDEAGAPGCSEPLHDASPDGVHAVATSLASRLSYVLYADDDPGALRLAAYSTDGGSLRPVWRAQVPVRSSFAQDVHGRNVALVWPDQEGAAYRLLGRDAPALPAVTKHSDAVPHLSDDHFCGRPPHSEPAARDARLVKDKPSDVVSVAVPRHRDPARRVLARRQPVAGVAPAVGDVGLHLARDAAVFHARAQREAERGVGVEVAGGVGLERERLPVRVGEVHPRAQNAVRRRGVLGLEDGAGDGPRRRFPRVRDGRWLFGEQRSAVALETVLARPHERPAIALAGVAADGDAPGRVLAGRLPVAGVAAAVGHVQLHRAVDTAVLHAHAERELDPLGGVEVAGPVGLERERPPAGVADVDLRALDPVAGGGVHRREDGACDRPAPRVLRVGDRPRLSGERAAAVALEAVLARPHERALLRDAGCGEGEREERASHGFASPSVRSSSIRHASSIFTNRSDGRSISKASRLTSKVPRARALPGANSIVSGTSTGFFTPCSSTSPSIFVSTVVALPAASACGSIRATPLNTTNGKRLASTVSRMSESRFRSPESNDAMGTRTIARTLPSGWTTAFPSIVEDVPVAPWNLWTMW